MPKRRRNPAPQPPANDQRADPYRVLLYLLHLGADPRTITPVMGDFLSTKPPLEHLEHVAQWLDYRRMHHSAAAVRSHAAAPWAWSLRTGRRRQPSRPSAHPIKRQPPRLVRDDENAPPPPAPAEPAAVAGDEALFGSVRIDDLRAGVPFEHHRSQLEVQSRRDRMEAHQLHGQQLLRINEREQFAHHSAEAETTLKQAHAMRALRELAFVDEDRERARRREQREHECAERKLDLQERREARLDRQANLAAWVTGLGALAGIAYFAYQAHSSSQRRQRVVYVDDVDDRPRRLRRPRRLASG